MCTIEAPKASGAVGGAKISKCGGASEALLVNTPPDSAILSLSKQPRVSYPLPKTVTNFQIPVGTISLILEQY